MNGDTATIPTVHVVRRRWKPHKERLAAAGGEQATSIRFHRACSWMARAEQMAEGQDHDLSLVIGSWISTFTSLSVIEAIQRWAGPGRSCFAQGAEKLGWTGQGLPDDHSLSLLIDSVIPVPNGHLFQSPSYSNGGS